MDAQTTGFQGFRFSPSNFLACLRFQFFPSNSLAFLSFQAFHANVSGFVSGSSFPTKFSGLSQISTLSHQVLGLASVFKLFLNKHSTFSGFDGYLETVLLRNIEVLPACI